MSNNKVTLLDQIQTYLDLGWHLIPLHYVTDDEMCSCGRELCGGSTGKHPIDTNWTDCATHITTYEQAERVWGRNPRLNVGAVTGNCSGIVVIDVDGIQGAESLTKLEHDLGRSLRETRIHQTGSGSFQLICENPDFVRLSNSNKNLKKPYPGIDIRGNGGQIVLPPSHSGKGPYLVLNDVKPSPLGSDMVDKIKNPSEDAQGFKITQVDPDSLPRQTELPEDAQNLANAYSRTGVVNEMSRFSTEYDLPGWDDLTYNVSWITLMLANSPWNDLDVDDTAELLFDNAPRGGDEDWNEARIQKCIDSALSDILGRRLARDLPPRVKELLAEIEAQKTLDKTGNTFARGERKLKIVSGDQIKMKRTLWLWKDRVALGTLSLIAGPGGLGKSTMAYWVAAQVTTGNLYGEFYGVPKDVIVLATEDSWEHTILPRLIAAGADRSRCYRIEPDGEGAPAKLHNEVDRRLLKDMAEVLDVGLLILDPIMTHLGNKDSYKDAEVRSVLEPVVELADRCRFSIIGIIHNNKSGKTDPMALVMGSTAFGAVARSVHTVIWDPEDETHTKRLFGTVKNNLGKMSGIGPDMLDTWVFDTESVTMETEDDDPTPLTTSRIRFLGDHDKSIEDALVIKAAGDRQAEKGGEKTNKGEAAKDWLANLFKARGRLHKAEVIRIADADMMSNHSARTLERAMKDDFFGTARVRENDKTVAYWGLADHFEED